MPWAFIWRAPTVWSYISKRLKRLGIFRFILLGAGILLSVYAREYFPYSYNIGFLQRQGFDWIYALIMILFIFEITQSYPLIQRPLAFMGHHLFNIFLFHTFIFAYYWPDFIYGFQYPYLIFLVLLSISLIVSVTLEYIRKLLGFEKILSWIDGIKVKDIFLSIGSLPQRVDNPRHTGENRYPVFSF